MTEKETEFEAVTDGLMEDRGNIDDCQVPRWQEGWLDEPAIFGTKEKANANAIAIPDETNCQPNTTSKFLTSFHYNRNLKTPEEAQRHKELFTIVRTRIPGDAG